mmetsp:Transcript_34421/g.70296  ORF Transcript_34421/g.70296 Transcript_34421/m.70296 type:complete len:312 (-) Transcript_34421:274-1209(-)
MARVSTLALLCLAASSTASAFTAPRSSSAFVVRGSSAPLRASFDDEIVASFDPLHLSSDDSSSFDESSDAAAPPLPRAAAATAAAALAWSASSPEALAAGPDWGIFEGRTGSLLHPVVMASMFLLSLSTGFLGLQWRRQRTIGDEISSLKKGMPDLMGASSVAEAMKEAEGAEGGPDLSRVQALKGALGLEGEIAALAKERKELSGQGLRDKHYGQGAILAFLGTAFAIEGPLNTYARAGKLFPGPHLYAGASCVVLWAAAYACVPFMSKGNETARSLHIAANTIGVGLFGWQVVTGLPILFKVVELTKWP